MQTALEIDRQALEEAKKYRDSESALLDTLIRIERHQIYKIFGFGSLRSYCMNRLELCEARTTMLCAVAKKSVEVPRIQTLLQQRCLHLSHARRVVSVITPQNQDHWLSLASSLSENDLRREVARVNPEAEERASIRPLREGRSRLTMGISWELEDDLKRVCDLLSQKLEKPVCHEEAFNYLVKEFLDKNDPVRKAERHQALYLNTKKARRNMAVCLNTELKIKIHQAERIAAMGSKTEAHKDKTAANRAACLHTETKIDKLQEKTAVCLNTGAKKDTTTKKSAACLNTETKADKIGKKSGVCLNTALGRSNRFIPAAALHALHLRDQGQCTFLYPNGNRCEQRRWVEKHHHVAVKQGGPNTAENLQTLCSFHHRFVHRASG